MLMPSIFGENLFDDWMRFPTERQSNAGYRNAELMKTDIKDVDGNYELSMDLRYTGQCSRSFYVGKDLEHEDIHAKYDNGVLTVTFPKEAKKKEPEEKKFISIEG